MIDELRPLTAGRLLDIWKKSHEISEDPLERVLLSNAQVLAESCFFQGKPAFEEAKTVLDSLTGCQMEKLLCQLAEERLGAVEITNPTFDQGRFEELLEG